MDLTIQYDEKEQELSINVKSETIDSSPPLSNMLDMKRTPNISDLRERPGLSYPGNFLITNAFPNSSERENKYLK